MHQQFLTLGAINAALPCLGSDSREGKGTVMLDESVVTLQPKSVKTSNGYCSPSASERRMLSDLRSLKQTLSFYNLYAQSLQLISTTFSTSTGCGANDPKIK